MTKLEKGMYVKSLKSILIYDPNTFEPITISEGSTAELDYVGFGLLKNKEQKPWPLIALKFKEGSVVFSGEQIDQFNETFEVL